MPQVIKEEVRESIRAAALRVFAVDGYSDATVARIAREAGVSVGNVYRYFDNKETLFDAVVPTTVVLRFKRLLSERIAEAEGAGDVLELGPEHRYWLASGRLFDFVLERRLEIVVFLGRGAGTRYEGVYDQVVAELVEAVKRQSSALAGRGVDAETTTFDLEQIYRNFVNSLVRVLEHFHDEVRIREAVSTYERYHLGGLAALLR